MILTFEEIDSPEQAEALRVLRNECAEWMTRDTSQVTRAAQQEFYRDRIATGQVEGFLMYANGEPVAYGLIVWDEQRRAWSSTGVAASRRGEGFGRRITVENVRRAHARGVPMWAEVRRDNVAQQRICLSIGYRLTGRLIRDGVAVDVMRCDELAPECA